MFHSAFQVTSTTHDSDDDDCIIVSDVKNRLVNRPDLGLDDEVDSGLSAFGILIGNLTAPKAQAVQVKSEPTDPDDDSTKDQSFEQERETATKTHVNSHNRHGEEIDHAVGVFPKSICTLAVVKSIFLFTQLFMNNLVPQCFLLSISISRIHLTSLPT